MALVLTELELYKDVTAGTEDKTQFHVPVSGDFLITKIESQGAFDINCAVEVLFDGQLVWFSKGVSTLDRTKEFVGDGVKKVELVLNALDLPSGSVFLGGYVMIEQVV